jgi:hypothetical protein
MARISERRFPDRRVVLPALNAAEFLADFLADSKECTAETRGARHLS